MLLLGFASPFASRQLTGLVLLGSDTLFLVTAGGNFKIFSQWLSINEKIKVRKNEKVRFNISRVTSIW